MLSMCGRFEAAFILEQGNHTESQVALIMRQVSCLRDRRERFSVLKNLSSMVELCEPSADICQDHCWWGECEGEVFSICLDCSQFWDVALAGLECGELPAQLQRLPSGSQARESPVVESQPYQRERAKGLHYVKKLCVSLHQLCAMPCLVCLGPPGLLKKGNVERSRGLNIFTNRYNTRCRCRCR